MSIIRRAQLETPLSASYANSSSYAETASFALNGGGGTSNIDTGSFATTGSNAFKGNQVISGSVYLRSGSVIDSIGADIYIKAGVGNNAGVALYNNNSTQYLAVDDTGSYANKFTVADRLTVSGLTTTRDQQITGSLIQGLGNVAGEGSHAEGDSTQAIGLFSHAEGLGAIAYGGRSHAEGQDTIASGSYSHAEGYQTIALADHQHVQGQWNATSSVLAAFIVGNGTDNNNRSNLIHAAGNEVQISGSMIFSTGGITGSLFGTASWARNVLTASYVNPLQQDVIITGSIYIPNSTYGIYFSGSSAASKLTWNDTDGTLDLGLKGGNVTLQIGQESVIRVVNKTGANLLESEYKAVRIRRVDEGGAQGQRLAIVLAQSNNDANSVDTLGLVTENIDSNEEGFITNSGLVRNINATGTLQGETWADGDVLYLSPTVPGKVTKIKPQAPEHTVVMGYVVYAHQNQGKIFVKVDNGYEIDELHNVRINTGSLSNGDLLVYSGSVWANTKQLTGSYQITGSLLLSGSGLTVSSSRFQMPQYINISGSTRRLLSGGSSASVDWENRILLYNDGSSTSIDWGALQLINPQYGISVDWSNYLLYDANVSPSVDWTGRALYTPDGNAAALNWNDNIVNFSDTYHYRYHDLTQQGNFVSQVLYSGEVIDAPTFGSVPQYRVVALSGSSWVTASLQGHIDKMLGIALEGGKSPSNILLNGDISFDGTDGPNIEPGLTPSDNGKPVYIKTTGTMTTSPPTTGYVRILGHVYYNNGTGYIFKFRPSNDWYKLG